MLARKGHEIHFITSDIPVRLDQWYPNIYYHDVEVNQYPVFRHPPYDLTLASKMAETVKNEGLDLLHVHYALPHAICAYLAKKIVGDQTKIVTTLHGTDITVLGYDPTLSELIRFGIEQSDAVTAVSANLIQQTKDLLQPHKEIETVHNFVDENTYFEKDSSHLREQLNIANDEKVLTHVSNFRAVKRVPDVIKVFAKVRQKHAAKLLLLGDGPQFQVARQLVMELGITDDVLFLGEQNNVADVLSISDVKLLLSEKESFGLVLLEAMACGVPTIGTNIGGIPEVIADGETGYIFDVGDIDRIAAKTIELLSDPILHKTMAKQAKKRVNSHFHSRLILEQYEKIYYQTLNTSLV